MPKVSVQLTGKEASTRLLCWSAPDQHHGPDLMDRRSLPLLSLGVGLCPL